jgi:hypothetical protein
MKSFTHRKLKRAAIRNFIGVSYSVFLLPRTTRAMAIIAANRATAPMERIMSVPGVVVAPLPAALGDIALDGDIVPTPPELWAATVNE